MGQIYCIKNTVNGKCYVGQTCNTFSKRYPGFWYKKIKTSVLKNSILKHGHEAFEVMILEDNVLKEDLNLKEGEWATKMNAYHPNGYNIRECGMQPGKWMRKRDEEFRKKISLSKKGFKHKEESKSLTSKPVICSNGQIYKSTIEAAKCLGIRQSCISGCANGKIRQVNNLTFSFDLSNVPIVRPKKNDNTPVSVIRSDGKVYKNITVAAKEINIDVECLYQHLRGVRNTVKGFRFSKDLSKIPEHPPIRDFRIKCSNGKIYENKLAAERDLCLPHRTLNLIFCGKKKNTTGLTFERCCDD